MERIEAMEYFWLLTALPLFGLLLLLRSRWSRQLRKRLGEGHDLQQLFPGSSFRRPGLKNVLMVLVLLSLVLGIANPQTGSKMESVQREGIDLIFAVDVSKSMLAEDVAPSRLARARQLVSACVDELGGDRVGLIAYAGEAFPQLPITTDLAAAKLFLDRLRTDQISSQGTAMSEAVELAARMFSDEGAKARALILISDGEDHEGALDQAIEKARTLDIRIYSIGMGTERGGPIPVKDANGRARGYKEDRDGNKVITKLDRAQLETLARQTDGKYLSGQDTRPAIEALLEEFSRMERSEYESSLFTDYEDQFYWFCGLALFLLLLDSFIMEKKTQWLDRWLH